MIETPKMELKLEIKVYNLGLFFLAFPVDGRSVVDDPWLHGVPYRLYGSVT